jgi:hypothetical protein
MKNVRVRGSIPIDNITVNPVDVLNTILKEYDLSNVEYWKDGYAYGEERHGRYEIE